LWGKPENSVLILTDNGLGRIYFDEMTLAEKADFYDWEAERPEKEGLWKIMTTLVGDENYDFEEAIWYLQEFPLDLISWTIKKQSSERF